MEEGVSSFNDTHLDASDGVGDGSDGVTIAPQTRLRDNCSGMESLCK